MPRLTARQISDYALKEYEEELPVRAIINSINRVPRGTIKTYRDSKMVEYEILRPGVDILNKSIGGAEDADKLGILIERKIHPRIIEVSGSLFASGHYPQAVLEAFKEINNRVKNKSRLFDKDGTNLMSDAFNPRAPKLKISKLENQSDLDEQEGFKLIFMGSMLGIRNPKAHEIIVQRDPVKALEYLAFASLLLRRIDESEVVSDARSNQVS